MDIFMIDLCTCKKSLYGLNMGAKVSTNVEINYKFALIIFMTS